MPYHGTVGSAGTLVHKMPHNLLITHANEQSARHFFCEKFEKKTKYISIRIIVSPK